MFLIVLVWATLTLSFIWRFKVIALNFRQLVRSPQGLLSLPRINLRPLHQLVIWIAELMLLLFFYSAFGISIAAHITASVCACGMMFLLREKNVPFLEGLQLLPIPIPGMPKRKALDQIIAVLDSGVGANP